VPNALFVAGSGGLGLGLVREHLARGWDVTATHRSASPELETLARAHPGHSRLVEFDATAQGAAVALADRLRGQRFDLLFLNPGNMVGRGMALGDIPDADIIRIFLTNAVAPIRAANALADLVVTGGMVAFMSSILGSVGGNEDGRAELYRASKAALNSFIRSFAARHAERGLTVLAVHPGVVRTAMGGPSAPLDIDTSARGVADVLAARRGAGGVAFVDYMNVPIPW
jgi:NAD(P)-dependent dehydrogenase (short-subunit alcohol dehydrogenase family)